MTIQEDIILFLSILVGFLIYGFYILKKSLYNHNIKLKEELDNFKVYTRKEFERIRFTKKPICKVGDVYNKRFVVTKAKYIEYPNYKDSNHQPLFLLTITNEYELLDLDSKQSIHFRSNSLIKKFLKDNNLNLDETKN